MLDMISQGGPLMWPILALAVIGPILSLVWAGLAATRRRVPAFLWLFAPIAAAALGAGGTVLGLDTASDAIAMASPETRDALALSGAAVALYTNVIGHLVAVFLLLVVAWTAAIGHALKPGEYAELDIKAAVAAGFIVCVGFVGTMIWGWTMHAGGGVFLVPVVMLLAGLALPVVGLRRGWEHEERDAGRMGAACVLVAFSGLGAVILTWTAVGMVGEIGVNEALAHAAPETRAALVTSGQVAFSAAGQMGPPVAIIFCVAALIIAAPPLQHILSLRSFAGVFVAGGLAAVFIALEYAAATNGNTLVAETGPNQLPRIVSQVGNVPDLMLPDEFEMPEVSTVMTRPAVLYEGDKWVEGQVDAETNTDLDLPMDPDAAPLLVVSPGLRLKFLLEPDWFGEDSGTLRFLAFVPGTVSTDDAMLQYMAYRSVGLRWVYVEEPEEPEVAEGEVAPEPAPRTYAGVAIVGSLSGVEVVTAQGSAALSAGVGTLRDISKFAESAPGEILFVPAPTWTAQDLLTYCLAARSKAPETTCAVARALPTPEE